jgi:hypothetical protein
MPRLSNRATEASTLASSGVAMPIFVKKNLKKLVDFLIAQQRPLTLVSSGVEMIILKENVKNKENVLLKKKLDS